MDITLSIVTKCIIEKDEGKVAYFTVEDMFKQQYFSNKRWVWYPCKGMDWGYKEMLYFAYNLWF